MSITITVTDGALGLVPADNGANTAIVGVCSSGTAEQVYAYTGSEAISTLKSELGFGPGPEDAAWLLSTDGAPVYVCKADTTGGTAAACSTVSKSGSGPEVSVDTATPYDDYEVRVVVVVGGAVGTSTFKYSLDGGDTYSGVITTASTYAIPNSGITIAFAAGTYVAGDTYTFTATAATYTTGKMGSAVDALLNEAYDWSLLHVVGMPSGADDDAKAAAQAAMVAAVQTKLATAATAFRYARAFVDSSDVANNSTGDGKLTGAFASVDAPRVCAGGGFMEHTSALVQGRKHKRPASWAAVARARQVPIHESIAWVGRGSLGASVALKTAANPPTKYLDGRTRSTLASNRFVSLRTHVRKPGVFIDQPNTMAASTSDFVKLQNGRVIDRACSVAYAVLVEYQDATIRVNATTGYILETDAKAIEARVDAALRDALTARGHAVAVVSTVNRTTNMLSTSTLKVKIRVTPNAYASAIEAEIGLNNPALQQIAA